MYREQDYKQNYHQEKRFLFSARTRGLDVKNNFKQGKKDLQCRLCRKHIEDQQSLLTCEALDQGSYAHFSTQPRYSDIFSENMEKLAAITTVLHKKFDNFTYHVNRQASQPSSSATDVMVIINKPVDFD